MYHNSANTIEFVSNYDPEIAALMSEELTRQRRNIELIASENIASPAVIAAMGTILTNKYAEGLPGKRYYGGCEHVDEVERVCIRRACELFGAAYANVQPHSGAQANLAVYAGLLQPGDTIVGMNLACGGHLTHGAPVNMSGKYYNSIGYGVNPVTGYLDYDVVESMVKQNKPRLLVAGASAYPRAIDFKLLAEIAHRHGALFMADMAHIAGLVAGGAHMSPVPYADVVTTTTHKSLRGPRGGMVLTNDADIAKKLNSGVFPGTQGGPLMHVIASKAVCLKEANTPEFKDYAHRIVSNAKALSETLLGLGMNLVTGGTDNHLMLTDLRSLGITGKELETRLDQVHITVNKNAIPNDPQKPALTSGVRIGTPAVTTRGMNEEDMKTIGKLIYLAATDFENAAEEIRAQVIQLTDKYPLYE